jgi:hypothetical protein
MVHAFSTRNSAPGRVLILVGQFEELYTLVQDDPIRRKFVDESLTREHPLLAPSSQSRSPYGATLSETLFLTERSAIDCTEHKSVSGRGLRDARGKQRTNNRTRDLMIRSGEECEGAVAVAYPDLGGSGIEIEDAFFGDLGCGIGGGEDFDTNLRGARQKGDVLADLIPTGIKPTDINSFDAVSGRNRALGQCLTLRSKLNQ